MIDLEPYAMHALQSAGQQALKQISSVGVKYAFLGIKKTFINLDRKIYECYLDARKHRFKWYFCYGCGFATAGGLLFIPPVAHSISASLDIVTLMALAMDDV